MSRRLTLFLLLIPAASFAWSPNSVSYRLSVELDPATAQVRGHERVQITNHTGQILQTLYFHVYPNAFRGQKDSTYMQEMRAFEHPDNIYIQALGDSWLTTGPIFQNDSANGSHGRTQVSSQIQQELLTIQLAHPLLPAQSTEIEMDFTTQIGPIAERSGTWDGNFAIGQWFPKLVVYDGQGWALEHNRGYHYVGEFYGDFGSYDVDIRVPQDMKVGATGHLTSEIPDRQGKKTLSFHAENVHDFAWVADRRFSEEVVQSGNTRIHVLYRNPDRKAMGEYAKKALEYYASRVGPYPYEDYTVAETYYNGTMEYPQIVFTRSWPAGFGRWFEKEVISLLELGVIHETAHQWFYGMVGNNEVKNAWLDEGFSTYLEEAFMRDTHGEDENLFPWTSVLRLTDRQLGDMIWRSQAPDVKQPIQTPSYQFTDPLFYYSTVYYRTAIFFRHFEALVGKDKLNQIFHAYFSRMKFKNAEPEDWYAIVREYAGEDAVGWWRDWIEKNYRCDYAVSDATSTQAADGKYHHRFVVSQEGQFFAPVDVEFEDTSGKKIRQRIYPTRAKPQELVELVTDAPMKRVEVDPDHVTGDYDRFNNEPSFFPKVKILPFTTRTVPPDAIVFAPLPLVNKRPGLGLETGAFIPVAHYLDWAGTAMVAYDTRFSTVNADMTVDTLQPELDWGWTLAYRTDALINRGSFYAKKSLGPEVGHDPQNNLLIGPEYFGNQGDNIRGVGLGLDYQFTNLQHGKDLGYSLTLHNSGINYSTLGGGDRFYGIAETDYRFAYKSRLKLRGILGSSVGSFNTASRFNLQAEEEGGMRFDWADVGEFKVKTIRVATAELHFPVPYGTWVDSLYFIHGPGWDWYLFGDASNSPGFDRTLADFGVGTTAAFAMGGFGGLNATLELVPWQNASSNGEHGWQSPIVLFYFTARGM